MKQATEGKKEIYFIIFAFVFLALFVVVLRFFGFYEIDQMQKMTSDIYNHPFKVTNSALGVKLGVYKIHRDMKDLVLFTSQDELSTIISNIDENEKQIYKNLDIIKENVLGKEGLQLQEYTQKKFQEWKIIRNEVITLVRNNKIEEAMAITKANGTKQVLKLENSANELYMYAQNRAANFKSTSDTTFDNLKVVTILALIFFLSIVAFVAYLTTKRISNYIDNNEHLRGILSVIRDVNQLIVREKSKQKLLQESCKILTTNRVFEGALIILLKESGEIDTIAGADESEDFEQLKDKINKGWVPHCMLKTGQSGKPYSIIENTQDYCLECPLKEIYKSKSAFNIEIKYNKKLYGYLTLRIQKRSIEYSDKIELLQEVAGDIAYAIYNIETELEVYALKELYANTINSLENLLFVKDENLIYITCNRAFEKFIGKSKGEIIGKNDYDIIDKETADFFRSNDEKVLKDNIQNLNYEWVTYPDGKKVYLLTTKSPLLNDYGEIIGLVGNSVDVTKEKKSEDSLIESEKRFKQLMKESPSVIEVYDLDGFQIEVNHAYEVLWGFSANLTLHKFNLFKSEEVEKKGLLNYVKKAYNGESVTLPLYEFDSRGETEAFEHGRKRTLNTRIYPLKDSKGNVKNIVITHEDVTERERSILGLKQKTREMETIVREAPNPIILHNEDGKIILINKTWEMLSGYSYGEIDTIEKWTQKAYGKKMSIVKEDIDKLYKLDKKVDEGEYSIFTKNGDTIIWQFSSAPLGVLDGKRVIISSAMDITELKKKDEIMMVQSRHAAMGEMISMIAHQWRQPISIVSMIANNMLLDITLGSFDKNRVEEYSKDILEQTEHLSKTIDDFRNFFKPDRSVAKVNLKNIIDEVYSIVKGYLINHSIKLNVSCTSNTEIDGYPRELMQVFVNIVNNAKDALILKKPQEASIDVSIYEDEEYLNTKICDNAGGVPKEILAKIFDPYFTTKDEKTGTGLGLYMSKMIIEEHLKGKIDIENNKNGACFIVKLPKKGVYDNV